MFKNHAFRRNTHAKSFLKQFSTYFLTYINVFLRATAVPAGTAEARISYGNSVRPSVCLSRPGGERSPGDIVTPGLHHMIA